MSSSLALPDGFVEREAQPEEAALVAGLMNAYDASFGSGEQVTTRSRFQITVFRKDLR